MLRAIGWTTAAAVGGFVLTLLVMGLVDQALATLFPGAFLDSSGEHKVLGPGMAALSLLYTTVVVLAMAWLTAWLAGPYWRAVTGILAALIFAISVAYMVMNPDEQSLIYLGAGTVLSTLACVVGGWLRGRSRGSATTPASAVGIALLALGTATVATAPANAEGAQPAPGKAEVFHMRLLASDKAGGGDAAISPDGRFFVSSSRRGGSWDLWLYEIAGDIWTQLTDDPAEDFEAQWSPDGRRLVFTSTRTGQKDLWLLDLPDRSLRQLTDSEFDDEYPQWSPDGRRVVYTGGPWGQNHFYTLEPDEEVADGALPTPRQASAEPGRAGACSFAPRGGGLFCHRYDTGNGDLLYIDLADGRQRRLTEGHAWDYKPTVSPDGCWIAFSRSVERPTNIWLKPVAGGPARMLQDSGGDDRWPGWSREGDVFFHRVVTRGAAVERWDRQSGQRMVLVASEEQPLQATLGPAGERLVYCAARGSRFVLRLQDLTTGATRDLDTGPGSACYPRFSPDGEILAFTVLRDEQWEIATMPAAGGAVTDWTTPYSELRGLNGPLSWAPDGGSLVFKGDTLPFESDLYLLSFAEGTVTNLTRDAWYDEAPSFTPDGESLVYMSTRGGGWTWGLYRLSLKDGTVSLFAGPDYEEKNYPQATGSGHLLWSFRDDEGVEHLMELSPDGEARQLAGVSRRTRWPSYAQDGRWVLYTVIDEWVEYWLAENPLGRGSPVRAPEVTDETILTRLCTDFHEDSDCSVPPEPAPGSSGASSIPSAIGPPGPVLTLASHRTRAAWRNPVDFFHR